MKKVLTVLVAMFAFAALASAQPRAIGVRVGWGGEVSYQHTLGGENFLEADLGWAIDDGVNVAAAYDFKIAPLGPLNFYAGPAADLWIGDKLGLGIGGQIGLEYIFDAIPLQLSLDWRPLFTLIPSTGFGWHSIGLGIRYAF